jgi:hypothetical protein
MNPARKRPPHSPTGGNGQFRTVARAKPATASKLEADARGAKTYRIATTSMSSMSIGESPRPAGKA